MRMNKWYVNFEIVSMAKENEKVVSKLLPHLKHPSKKKAVLLLLFFSLGFRITCPSQENY
jgi:hypothetical protein